MKLAIFMVGGIHGGETVAIIELPNRVVYAKPKDFEFVDEIHAVLAAQKLLKAATEGLDGKQESN